jgi:hypothetical protein
MNEMARECYECGNTNEEEIEYKTITTDEGDGNEKKIKLWLCIDNDDCEMRVYNKYYANK